MHLNIEFGGHGVLDKKTKVEFDISNHQLEDLLDCVHVSIWRPAKIAFLEVISTLSLLLLIYLGIVGYIP